MRAATGQVDLFTKRIRKPPAAPEFLTHCAIADTLRAGLVPGCLWFHVPNGGERDAFIDKHGNRVSPEGGRLKRMGTLAGVSDFLVFPPPDARLHALELKRRGEKPTPAQMSFMMLVRLAGGESEWVDNFEDAIRVLKQWGALRVSL